MPNPVNHITHQQWDTCARCGAMYPIGRLQLQKGLLVHQGCWDNPLVEEHAFRVAQVLGVGESMEGADLRMLDRSCFSESDEPR